MLEELPVDSYEELVKAVSQMTCEEIAEAFDEAEKLLKPELAELDPSGGVLFHGDIHGEIRTLYEIWDRVGLDKVLDRYKLVFLGDYVDRGDEQLEALLLVLALKAQRPEDVVVLRGNHEPPPWLPAYPHDFPDVLEARCGPSVGRELYAKAVRVFERMPLIAVVDDVIAFHGGPPATKVLEGCDGKECLSNLDRKAIEDVLWSDPDELVDGQICLWSDEPDKCLSSNPRGAGVVWGAGLTREFLERVGGKTIMRGHTAVDGFASCHKSKVFTLFTRSGPPYFNAQAAAVLMKGRNFNVIVVPALQAF